jgi:WD40 repeat protein
MGEGETVYRVPPGSRLVGFLSGGRIVYTRHGDVPGSLQVLGGGGAGNLRAIWQLSDSSESADLVAGTVDIKGTSGVVSASNGKVFWRTPRWELVAFSPDGRYLSAKSAVQGEPGEVAILDARTGATVERFRLADHNLQLTDQPAWETDTTLLFGASSRRGQAMLRLATDGTVDRATELIPASSDPSTWVFTTRP